VRFEVVPTNNTYKDTSTKTSITSVAEAETLSFTVAAKDTDVAVKSITIKGEAASAGVDPAYSVALPTNIANGSALVVAVETNKTTTKVKTVKLNGNVIDAATATDTLKTGDIIDITVEAESGATKTYRVTVTLPSNDTSISSKQADDVKVVGSVIYIKKGETYKDGMSADTL
jgi:hypothetical protein